MKKYTLFTVVCLLMFAFTVSAFAQSRITEYRIVSGKEQIPYSDYIKSKPVGVYNDLVFQNIKVNGKTVQKETVYAQPLWEDIDVDDVPVLSGKTDVFLVKDKTYVNLRKISPHLSLRLDYQNKKLNVYADLICNNKEVVRKISTLKIIEMRKVIPTKYKYNSNAKRNVVTNFKLSNPVSYVDLDSLNKALAIKQIGYDLYFNPNENRVACSNR